MAKSLSSQLKRLKEEQLRDTARENTSIQKKDSEGTAVIKKGNPLDHEVKQKFAKNKGSAFVGQTVGMSIGCTLNMGDYESFRVDCWLSDTVKEEETIEQAFLRVQSILEERVEEVSAQYRA